jgi:predicted nucleotidyltransferase
VKYEVRDGKAYYDGRTLAEWVPDLVTRLVEGFAPERVVLFGSVARGDDGPDSDIDLLVVLRKLEGRRHDAAVAMRLALGAGHPPVDILVTDVERLDERGERPGMMQAAWTEGQVVHG